jgi:predicted ribosome quality control (RQC) complex YloA/Tae2 family protein
MNNKRKIKKKLKKIKNKKSKKKKDSFTPKNSQIMTSEILKLITIVSWNEFNP